MHSLMFALFLVVSGFSLGISVFAIPVRWLLWEKTRDRIQLWHVTLKSGIALLVGLFLFLVLPNQAAHDIPPNATTWIYLGALTLIGAGSMGLAAQAINELLDREDEELHSTVSTDQEAP